MREKSFMRIHPLWLIIELIKVLRNVITMYIFLYFIGKYVEFIEVFKIYVVIIIFIYSVVSIMFYWRNFKFRIEKNNLEIYKGKFFSTASYIPLDSVTGYSEHYNFLERLFNLSSLTIKLQTTDEEKDLKVPVINKEKSQLLKSSIDQFSMKEITDKTEHEQVPFFTLSKSQLVKGSISSASIIVFLIFLYSLYEKINEYKNIDTWINIIKEKGQESFLYMMIIILTLIILSLVYGFIKTSVKYGNFELYLTEDKICTTWGVFSKINNNITKRYISAIIIKASLLQQLFKIENIEVINMDSDKENIKSNTLTPFIETNNTIKYIKDILGYEIINKNFYKLPIKSIVPKLIRSSFIWGTCLILSLFFDETWYLYVFLSVYILFAQVLQTYLSQYSYSKRQIIFIKKGMSKEKFITSFSNINEMKFKQSFIQKYLKLYTVEIINKASPVYKKKLHDIPEKHIIKIKGNFVIKYERK